MVWAFRKSRLAIGIILALTAGIVAAIWIRDIGKPLYIPVVATVLMVPIGCLTARLVGNIVAASQNTSMLSLLHMELDPQRFLTCYEPIPGRIPQGSRDHAIAANYLADGYAAAGDFDRAIQAVGPAPVHPRKDDPALDGVYYGNVARYALGKGDIALADQSLQELDGIIEEKCASNPRLSVNLRAARGILRQHRAALLHEEIESEWLTKQLEASTYKLRTLQILQILAMDAANRKDEKALNRYMTQLRQESGKTCFRTWKP